MTDDSTLFTGRTSADQATASYLTPPRDRLCGIFRKVTPSRRERSCPACQGSGASAPEMRRQLRCMGRRGIAHHALERVLAGAEKE